MTTEDVDLGEASPRLDAAAVDVEMDTERAYYSYQDPCELTDFDETSIYVDQCPRPQYRTLAGRLFAFRRCARFCDNQNFMQIEIIVKPATTRASTCALKHLVFSLVLVLIVTTLHWALAANYQLDSNIVTLFYVTEIILFSAVLVLGTLLCCILVARGFRLEFKCSDSNAESGLADETDTIEPNSGLSVALPVQDQPPTYEEAVLLPKPNDNDYVQSRVKQVI